VAAKNPAARTTKPDQRPPSDSAAQETGARGYFFAGITRLFYSTRSCSSACGPPFHPCRSARPRFQIFLACRFPRFLVG
jgi:hypothetical protein